MNTHQLRNKLSKEEALERLAEEQFERTTLSFYRYVHLANVEELRDQLWTEWTELGILGRIYVAEEGINAQLSVPTHRMIEFRNNLNARPEFADIPFKVALEEGDSFWKLTIKVRKQIVADGLQPEDYDVTNVGRHLTAREWNEAMADPETVVVDMRNQYESEVGHFENAITPDADTFKDELQIVREELKDKKDKKVLLYCTGGIRCEKASAYLKAQGFEDVNQMHGGIIQYRHDIEKDELENKFRGKNYVFDGRTAERVSDDVISKCHQCGQKCDDHTNCTNEICNLLFIQCARCKEKMLGACTDECREYVQLPEEQKLEIRKQTKKDREDYRARVRPKLKLKTAQE